MITNTDLFNMLILAFLFNAGLIFMVIGYFVDWPKNIVFHILSAVTFLELGVLIPTTATQYFPVGWAFIMLGVICFFSTAVEGVSAFYRVYSREPWEEEEWEE